MRKFYLLLFLLVCELITAQDSQRYHSGIFLNHKEKPQNFLKILNKNSGVYELTDEKGFAIIAAKLYDTLVWNNGKNILVVYNPEELKSILERKIQKKGVPYILSKVYDSLISKESKDEFSMENSELLLTKNSDHNFSSIRKLKEKNINRYKLKQQAKRYLKFNGSFTTSFDVKSRNAIPQTQTQYVQGRSENGQLTWKGPETDEIFSFGPNISTLGFDKQAYDYDQNGKLIPLGNGISPAKAYHNNLFNTTVGYNNQLRLNAFIENGDYYDEMLRLSLDLGQQKDQMYFTDQYHIINSFKTKLSAKLLKYILNFTFNYEENKATNSNRIGLFNRAYQNSLLTPISFSNVQSLFLTNGLQRSYSQIADNPQFLFNQENKYNYRDDRRQFNFDLARSWGDFKLNISQSYENDYFWNFDQYKPSTSGFFNGSLNERSQKNKLYNSNILGSYFFSGNHFSNVVSFNYILNNRESSVYNSLNKRNYFYQRTSQDYILNYKIDYDSYNDFELGANFGNSFYISNTSNKNNYWLPKASGYFTFKRIFDWYNVDFKIIGSYTWLSSEPEITRSYASYGTTLFSAQNAYLYFPINEAETFKNLSNINSKEWKTGFKLTYGYNLSFEAEYFKRKITDDVLPVFENNQLRLKNLADHTYSGYEANFSYDNIYLGRDFRSSQKASFFKYKDIVDRVNAGYNNFALAGFNDIYKTLTEGNVLGAVMGSYFERNSNGELIIDEKGYPKKANGMKIIADPTPDFVLKFNHNFTYKMFSLDINWEWKKGGQVWNGTQAVLDYYGRSQVSGDERNSKNYVFQGVNSNGNTNQIPVNFYDSNQDVSENKWTRYGYLGVAENYIQKADYVRINTISLTTKFDVGRFKRSLGVTFYVNNILLWQANKGVDPNQNFYDFDNGRGLDFFNLPSYKTFGCMVSFQF